MQISQLIRRHIKIHAVLFFGFLTAIPAVVIFSACSDSGVKEDVHAPAWVKDPARNVDNGYIVYVANETATTADRAKFKAEGLALSDLANECSFIPKGTRIEDRYLATEKNSSDRTTYVAYVKLAVEFQDCTAAQKAIDPDSVRRIANASFTDQLKSYQDYLETGELSPKSTTPVDLNVVDSGAPPPPTSNSQDDTQYYVMKQYVAYQKEVIILAPSTAYAPQSVETQNYYTRVRPTVQQIEVIQQAQPSLVQRPVPWSQVPNHPASLKPPSLAAPRPIGAPVSRPEVRPPPGNPYRQNSRQNNNSRRYRPPTNGKDGKEGRRRRGNDWEKN